MKKNILTVVALLVVAISFSACKKNEVFGTGYVQFTNAAELASPVDFYVSDVKKNTTALAYKQSTSYFVVSSKRQPAVIKVAASGASVFGFDITAQPGQYYSLFYIADGTGVAYPDNLSVPASGKARVRFINLNLGAALSNDFGVTGGAKLINNLTPKEASDYYEVAPGTSFSVYTTGTTTALLDIPTTIEAGHIYTIYLSGQAMDTVEATVLLQK